MDAPLYFQSIGGSDRGTFRFGHEVSKQPAAVLVGFVRGVSDVPVIGH
jgi:hypothetical protein